MPLTADGYTALRAADYLTLIRDSYEVATLLDIEWERDIFLGNITAIMATLLGDESEGLQAIYDARSPNNAQGVQLSDLSTGVGVIKQEATFSRATVTLTGTVGTPVLTGEQVRGGGTLGDALWTTLTDVTIGALGTVDVVVQANEAGAITAAATEISEIATPVAGWDSVTNALLADAGDDTDTDAELRLRRQQSLQISGAGSPASIRANLLGLLIDGTAVLTSALVLENDLATPITVEGVTISAHSIHAIVAPNTLTAAEKEAVATVIYTLLASGVNTDGTETVLIQREDLLDKEINFSFVTDVAVAATIVITMKTQEPGAPVVPTFAQVLPDITAGITAYFAALTPGDDVLSLSALAVIGAIDGIKSATVSYDRGAGAVVDVGIDMDEQAIESPAASITEAP